MWRVPRLPFPGFCAAPSLPNEPRDDLENPLMAEPWIGALVDKETGAEFMFHNRGEYLATYYSGGYREKKPDEPAQQQPVEQPARRESRRERREPTPEPVNDQPTVEHPAAE